MKFAVTLALMMVASTALGGPCYTGGVGYTQNLVPAYTTQYYVQQPEFYYGVGSQYQSDAVVDKLMQRLQTYNKQNNYQNDQNATVQKLIDKLPVQPALVPPANWQAAPQPQQAYQPPPGYKLVPIGEGAATGATTTLNTPLSPAATLIRTKGCLNCHSGAKVEKIDLTSPDSLTVEQWEKVGFKVQSGKMPPTGPLPDADINVIWNHSIQIGEAK